MPETEPDPTRTPLQRPPASAPFDRRDTDRVEAFSDGVYAIAITLLILEVRLQGEPESDAALGRALVEAWPTFLAYLTSFVMIGVMWINHHRIFALIGRTDATLLVLNLLLLLGTSFIPFPTALFAEHLGHGGERAAALLLGGTFLFVAVAYNVLWRYASHDRRLIAEEVPDDVAEAQTQQYRFGPLIYLVLMGVGWLSPLAYLLVTFALAVYFAVAPRWALSGRRRAG